MYTGREVGERREVNQGERVVLSLVTEVEKSGRNITTDNFFALARKLFNKKLTLIGTIRQNRVELPPAFVQPKGRIPASTIFGFQQDAMILSYCPKKGKVVTLMSTMLM